MDERTETMGRRLCRRCEPETVNREVVSHITTTLVVGFGGRKDESVDRNERGSDHGTSPVVSEDEGRPVSCGRLGFQKPKGRDVHDGVGEDRLGK